jgi:hypothetical protein
MGGTVGKGADGAAMVRRGRHILDARFGIIQKWLSTKLIDERDGLEGVQRVAGQVHDAKLGKR